MRRAKLETVVRRAPRTVGRRVRGELVVVVMPSFDACVLNDAAAAVWAALEQPVTAAEALAGLLETGCDVQAALSFLDELVTEGLVEVLPSRSEPLVKRKDR
jgi:hypothetical protein